MKLSSFKYNHGVICEFFIHLQPKFGQFTSGKHEFWQQEISAWDPENQSAIYLFFPSVGTVFLQISSVLFLRFIFKIVNNGPATLGPVFCLFVYMYSAIFSLFNILDGE